MGADRSPFRPQPRIWSAGQVAARLGKSESWFKGARKTLERAGFPTRDALLGGWDAAAVERWLDTRAGLANNCPGEVDGELERWAGSG